MTNTTNRVDGEREIVELSRRDMADITSIMNLAIMTGDDELKAIAVAKYKSLCDVLHSVGMSIAMV